MIEIYSTLLSANARKVVAFVRQLEIPHRLIDVNVYRGEGRAPEFLAHNPFGKVPTLVDGEITLWESNAILIYLSEAYADYALWSRSPTQRASLLRWLFWESAHWQPILTQVLRAHAGHVMVPSHFPEPATGPTWDAPDLSPLLRHLEEQLSAERFLGGSAVTLADFSVSAMTIYFRRLGFPFERYPALAAWYTRVHATAGWSSTSTPPWET